MSTMKDLLKRIANGQKRRRTLPTFPRSPYWSISRDVVEGWPQAWQANCSDVRRAAEVFQRQPFRMPKPTRHGGLIIDAVGPLTAQDCGAMVTMRGGSMSWLARELSRLGERRELDHIILRMDSPGGQITNLMEVVDEIGRLRESIDVYTVVDGGNCLGAAYAIACSCTSIIATSMSRIGCTRVHALAPDWMVMDRSGAVYFEDVAMQAALRRANAGMWELIDAHRPMIGERIQATFTDTDEPWWGDRDEESMAFMRRYHLQDAILLGEQAHAGGLIDLLVSPEQAQALTNGTGVPM